MDGYATAARGDLFVSGVIGADSLSAKLKAPQLTGYASQKADVTSVGGTLEAGVRNPFVFGAIIEPSIGVAYVRSEIGSVAAAGSQLRFDNPESLRVSIGARISGAAGGLSDGEWSTRYSVSLRAVDDLYARNRMVLASAGPDLPIVDNFEKQFGEAQFGLNSESSHGWTASANVRERFASGYNDLGVNLGLSLKF